MKSLYIVIILLWLSTTISSIHAYKLSKNIYTIQSNQQKIVSYLIEHDTVCEKNYGARNAI